MWDMPTDSDGRIGHTPCRSQIYSQDTGTRSSSVSTSALNFVSSSLMMKYSCPGSSLVMRAGFSYNPETKRQSSLWKSPMSPRPKKATQVKCNLKSMITTFFDSKGIVHKEFVPTGQNVNSGFYCEVLRRLRENVRSHRPSTFAGTDLAASPRQRPVPHFRPHPPVSGEKQNCCYPPPTVLP